MIVLLKLLAHQQNNNEVMSLFPFHLSKSNIDATFWSLIFQVRTWKFSMGLVSVTALSTSPFLGVWLFGLRGRFEIVGVWLAHPCLRDLALAPLPWACLAIWTQLSLVSITCFVQVLMDCACVSEATSSILALVLCTSNTCKMIAKVYKQVWNFCTVLCLQRGSATCAGRGGNIRPAQVP